MMLMLRLWWRRFRVGSIGSGDGMRCDVMIEYMNIDDDLAIF